MAAGLSDIADALDRYATRLKEGFDEPIFLGKAAKAVEFLQTNLAAYFQKNMQTVIDRSVQIGLFGAGVGFTHVLGADSVTNSAAIAAFVKGLPFGKKK